MPTEYILQITAVVSNLPTLNSARQWDKSIWEKLLN